MSKSGTIRGPDGALYIKSVQSGYQSSRWSSSEPWDDGAAGRVRRIVVSYGGYYGDIVRSIQTTYDEGGTQVTSQLHGGKDGNFKMINLSEPLTWVRGRYDSICTEPGLAFRSDEETDPWNYVQGIVSLTFGTSRATYGPFGRDRGGESFRFEASTEICGFHGRSSGSFLHALGVYIRSPATRLIGEPLPVSPVVNHEPLPATSSCSHSS